MKFPKLPRPGINRPLLFELAGAGLITAGAALFHVALGCIVAGALLVVMAYSASSHRTNGPL